MPMTSNSSSSPYVSPVQAMQFFSASLWADMLRATQTSPRPSYLAMIDPANPSNQRLQYYLGYGAGEIESACVIAKRYLPADLQNLTGVSQTLLQGLNAARGLWKGYQYLKPGTARPDDCPGAKESYDMLVALRDGESLFSFVEAEDAGLPSVNPQRPSALLTPNIVGRATRLFPLYPGIQNNQNQG